MPSQGFNIDSSRLFCKMQKMQKDSSPIKVKELISFLENFLTDTTPEGASIGKAFSIAEYLKMNGLGATGLVVREHDGTGDNIQSILDGLSNSDPDSIAVWDGAEIDMQHEAAARWIKINLSEHNSVNRFQIVIFDNGSLVVPWAWKVTNIEGDHSFFESEKTFQSVAQCHWALKVLAMVIASAREGDFTAPHATHGKLWRCSPGRKIAEVMDIMKILNGNTVIYWNNESGNSHSTMREILMIM